MSITLMQVAEAMVANFKNALHGIEYLDLEDIHDSDALQDGISELEIENDNNVNDFWKLGYSIDGRVIDDDVDLREGVVVHLLRKSLGTDHVILSHVDTFPDGYMAYNIVVGKDIYKHDGDNCTEECCVFCNWTPS